MTGTGCCGPIVDTPKAGTDLTTCSEGTWTALTAHTRVSEKVTKKQVMMFPVIYASQSSSLPSNQPFYSTLNHSSCLHLFLWHHPVIIFSLKFLWWKMNHRFVPTQAGACGMPFSWGGVLGEGATQRPFRTLVTHHPGKNASEKAREESGSCWSRNVAGNQYTSWLLQWATVLKEWSKK